jgi:translation initiation factor 2 subunit 1
MSDWRIAGRGPGGQSSEEDVEIQGADFYRCRFYRARVPKKDSVVKVEIFEIIDMGARVRLLEYAGIEGFIQMNQVSTRRVRSLQKYLKIGRREMMEVLRVDWKKTYIDLSKKSLMPDSREEAEKRWKKSKKVHEIMFEVAMKLKCPIELLYEYWGWDMYENCGFDHALDAMRVAM